MWGAQRWFHGRVARHQKTGASANNVGGARSSLQSVVGKYLSIQGRSRLSKTRPSSRNAFEVSWPLHHVADSSLRTAFSVCCRVDFNCLLADPADSSAGALS